MRQLSARACRQVGVLAAAASLLYLLSDVVETAQGRFSDVQLWLTLVAEAAVPFFVIGLALAQRPRLGRLGELAALGYAYAYVYFTGTVVYALANGTRDYGELTDRLGAAMTIHGAVMVVAGLGFGWAAIPARTLPMWAAISLMASVIFVAAAQDMPDGIQLVAAAIRDLGFAWMGGALWRANVAGRAATVGRTPAEAPIHGRSDTVDQHR